jgi:signal transduction histidine kinase
VIQLVREALSNVGRHAEATTCRVSLIQPSNGSLVLEVDDDGKGFDASAPPHGMGLSNLEARVHDMGGELTAVSTLGEGTTVSARWPA